MTDIAATIATRTAKTSHAGKAHGSAGAKGTDFAAVVAGLNADTPAAAPDEDAVTADTGKDADTATQDGSAQGDGKPVVQDLALTAAAQSAMADMVVTPPVALPASTVPTQPVPEGKAATDAIALDGPLRGRPSWRMAAAAQVPAAPVVDTAAPAAAPTEVVVPTGTDAVPAKAATTQKQSLAPEVRVPRAATAEVQADPVQTAAATEASPVADLLRRIADELPAKSVKEASPRTARAAAQLAARVAGVATTPTVTTDAASVETATVTTPVVPITVAIPHKSTGDAVAAPTTDASTTVEAPLVSVTADMLRRRPDVTRRAAAPVQEAATSAPATDATIAADAVTVPLPIISQTPVPAAPRQQAKVPAATDAATPAPAADAAVETLAVATADPAPVAVRPVMSALHRAAPAAASVDAQTVAPAAAQPFAAGDGSTGQQQKSDSGSDQSQAVAATASADPAAATTASASYADIVQSLPPIAQNAIGSVGETTAVVSTQDVGATLQNEVIDMGVGGQWIDRVAQEITQLAQGTGHSRFQLSPPNLGRIQIDIWHGEGGGESHVQMLTETSEAAQRLREGQSSLQTDARVAALALGSITIAQAANGFDAPDSGAQQQDNRQQQPNGDPSQAYSQQGSQSGQGGTSDQRQQPQPGQTALSGQNGQGASSQQQGGQNGQEGNNNGGQGKASVRRDVLDNGVGAALPDGGSERGTGDRLVRYA